MLPMPPSINTYWGERIAFAKAERRPMAMRYVTHEGKAYQKDIAERALEYGLRFHSKARLMLVVATCFRDARTADLDNRIKPLGDALMNAGVYEDDGQIDVLFTARGPTIKQGRIVIGLAEIKPDYEAVLSDALSVKYIAPHMAPAAVAEKPPQSGDLFEGAADNEAGVRRDSRRNVAGRRAARLGRGP